MNIGGRAESNFAEIYEDFYFVQLSVIPFIIQYSFGNLIRIGLDAEIKESSFWGGFNSDLIRCGQKANANPLC